MKANILDINGNKIREINTIIFEEPIREDIISKAIEIEKEKTPYSPKQGAGMNRSASGKIRHKRHSWKSQYGRGMSRMPRKIMWRRGTQFSWVGAIVPNAVGGRRAHPPKGIYILKKMNKKEQKKAMFSALTATSSIKELKKKYISLNEKKIDTHLPIIIEDKILGLKTKQFLESLKKILGELYSVAIQKKKIRAGKGKIRGRKNKMNAGLLLIIGKEETKKINGVDIIKASDLTITDLADNGARLTVFTENAIKELEAKK
jgi:large subunit ribosomal protein L4e